MVTADVGVWEVSFWVEFALSSADLPLRKETDDRLARIISIIMDLQSQQMLICGPAKRKENGMLREMVKIITNEKQKVPDCVICQSV